MAYVRVDVFEFDTNARESSRDGVVRDDHDVVGHVQSTMSCRVFVQWSRKKNRGRSEEFAPYESERRPPVTVIVRVSALYALSTTAGTLNSKHVKDTSRS